MAGDVKTRQAKLRELYDLQLDACIAALKQGDVSAATLNTARQFLSDNGVDVHSLKDSRVPLGVAALPFSVAEADGGER